MNTNHPPIASPLWHVPICGHQLFNPHQPYRYNNINRPPLNQCVIQISLQGHITYKLKNQTYIIPPNHLFVFIFGEKSSYYRPSKYAHQTYENIWINIEGAGLVEHIKHLRTRHTPVFDISESQQFINNMQNIIRLSQPQQQTSPTHISRLLHNYMTDIFELAEQSRSMSQTPTQRAIDKILSQPTYPWSLKTLASEAGCSREHLTRIFTQSIGCPPATYLNNIRTQRAIQLLIGSNIPISRISKNLGFASPITFARQIKTSTGLSPKKYREKHTQNKL